MSCRNDEDELPDQQSKARNNTGEFERHQNMLNAIQIDAVVDIAWILSVVKDVGLTLEDVRALHLERELRECMRKDLRGTFQALDRYHVSQQNCSRK